MPAKQHIVRLSRDDRRMLRTMVRTGRRAAWSLQRARILLATDAGADGPTQTDAQVAAAVDVSARTVARTRAAWCAQGLACLTRKPQDQPSVPPKLSTAQTLEIAALACTDPPCGHSHWSLRLLTARVIELEIVESICPETIRRALKKGGSSPGARVRFLIPPTRDASFVAAMEATIDTYSAPVDPAVPVVCVDEAGMALQADVRDPLPMRPGNVARQDPEYTRQGSTNLFMLSAPHLGWRHVTVTDQRTAVDWALVMRELVDDHFPAADRIIVVLDNLNTHRLSALYTAFPADEAHRIARQLELRFTPKHGSWLNMAELELAVLTRQCLNRRLPDRATVETEIAAWETARNAEAAPARWSFTIADARTRLTHLYPVPICDTTT